MKWNLTNDLCSSEITSTARDENKIKTVKIVSTMYKLCKLHTALFFILILIDIPTDCECVYGLSVLATAIAWYLHKLN